MKSVISFSTLIFLGCSFLTTASLAQTPAEAPQTTTAVCDGPFSDWLKGVADEARAKGVSEKSIQQLQNAQIDEKVLGRDRSQAVFNLTFAEFSKRVIPDYRLQKGKENLTKYANVFAKAEEKYGVPGSVISAFWGLETDFGAVQGDFDTLNALATLAHDCRRPDLFRPQLIALLQLFDQNVVDYKTTGAWAGEIGQMQLLPKDYLERGVDGDGDGKVDLKNSAPDAIMTAARMLSELGWKRGEPWFEEVTLTREDLPWEQAGRDNRHPISQWKEWGIIEKHAPLDNNDRQAALLLPMGRKGPAFLVYDNFDVFVEWNQSIVYATTVAYFSARLDGSPAFELKEPVASLSTDEVKELQRKLEKHGYEMGKIDGILGVKTRDAVRAEQLRLKQPADAWPTKELLDAL